MPTDKGGKKETEPRNSTRMKQQTSIAGKLAAMAAADSDTDGVSLPGNLSDSISMTQLVAELEKQRGWLKEDVSKLIEDSLKPLQTSVNALGAKVDSFQARLTATETTAGENFARLVTVEASVTTLQEQNKKLMEHVEDLENRSRRSNLRVVGIPEGSENGRDPVQFMSELLRDCLGDVFTEPPELERAHRSLAPKPREGQPSRSFIVRFLRFQQKEAALRWARNHEVKFNGSSLRLYPDLSAVLAKKRAAFNPVKQALYQKGVRFRLMHPARLVVTFESQTLSFEKPEDAMDFYKRRITKDG